MSKKTVGGEKGKWAAIDRAYKRGWNDSYAYHLKLRNEEIRGKENFIKTWIKKYRKALERLGK